MMDASFVFDYDTRVNEGEVLKFEGLSAFKKYLKEDAVKNPDQLVGIKIRTFGERDFIKSRAPYLWDDEIFTPNLDAEPAICGKAILLSILIGEYETAKELLSKIPSLDRESFGKISRPGACFGFGDSGLNVYELEGILYETSAHIPSDLRLLIFSRLYTESGDTGLNLRNVKEINSIECQKCIREDVGRMPFLLSDADNLYAGNLEAVLFIVKLVKDASCISEFLKSVITRHNRYDFIRDLRMTVATPGKHPLLKITTLLAGRKEIHHALLVFLLNLLSIGEEDDAALFSGNSGSMAVTEPIWECLKLMDPDEDEYENLLEEAKQSGGININFLIQVYEFYKFKTGKTKDLKLTNPRGDELSAFFNYLIEPNNVGFFNNTPNFAEIKKQLVNLLDNIGDIEYVISDDECLHERYDLKREIAKLLTNNAPYLEDVFLELLEKGLVPDEYLEYIIKRAMNNKRCAYMIPFLIMQKYGGLM